MTWQGANCALMQLPQELASTAYFDDSRQHCALHTQDSTLCLRSVEILVRQFKTGEGSDLISGNGLVVVLHEELQQALSGVAFGEVRLQGDALVCVFDAVWVCPQLREAGSSVAVQLVCFGIHGRRPPLQRLCVKLDCLWVLLLSEGLHSIQTILQTLLSAYDGESFASGISHYGSVMHPEALRDKDLVHLKFNGREQASLCTGNDR